MNGALAAQQSLEACNYRFAHLLMTFELELHSPRSEVVKTLYLAVRRKYPDCRGGTCSSCWRWMFQAQQALSSASTWKAMSAPTTEALSSGRCGTPSSMYLLHHSSVSYAIRAVLCFTYITVCTNSMAVNWKGTLLCTKVIAYCNPFDAGVEITPFCSGDGDLLEGCSSSA